MGRSAAESDHMDGLAHVRWVGGGSGAGKTTVARLLADRYGLQVYDSDATMGLHSSALSPSAAPLLAGFRRMTMDERWVLRDPATMYRTFPWYHGEGFDLLLSDLRSLPADPVILAEGFRLIPGLVRPRLSDPGHAVWLIPTPAFRRAAFASRGSDDAFWLRTADPHQALAKLLERDRIFTDVIAADAARQGLHTLAVDGARPVDALAEELAQRFGLR